MSAAVGLIVSVVALAVAVVSLVAARRAALSAERWADRAEASAARAERLRARARTAADATVELPPAAAEPVNAEQRARRRLFEDRRPR